MPHYVYLLRCGDGSLYTGYTVDLKRRLRQHQEGQGAKYTRGRGPFILLGKLEFATRSEALVAEAWIKSLGRQEKVRIICKDRGYLPGQQVKPGRLKDRDDALGN